MFFYKKMMLALASCVIVASCSNTDESISPAEDKGCVSFTASMKSLSRATETEFEEGDRIAVYAMQEDENGSTTLKPSGNYADDVTYSYMSGKFTNAKGIACPASFGVRYFAIYPNTAGSEVPVSKFQVKTNQHEAGQYTLSDLCTAVSDITKEKEVDLVFSHRLSHVIINLEGNVLGTGQPIVSLTNVNTMCDVNFSANSYVASGSKNVIRCTDNGTNSYKAIIVPQTIKMGEPFLSVSLNGKEHVLKAATDIVFASGKQRMFNLTVDNDEIVSYTSNILPWDEENRRLEIAPESLDLGTEVSATLTMTSHNGPTVYELFTEGEAGWAKLDKKVGVIPEYVPADASTIETITITADRTGLAPGNYSFTLIVRSDLGDTRVPVSMTVESQNAEGAQIFSCDENLAFTLLGCTISGTTATIEMKVTNVGTSTINLRLSGGNHTQNMSGGSESGYAYDDQGNKLDDSFLTVNFGDYSTTGSTSKEIPAGETTKAFIGLYNVNDVAALFSHIVVLTNRKSSLVLKNIAIEGRIPVALPSPQTTGTVASCSDELEIELLDCEYGNDYTTLWFRITNNGTDYRSLRLSGGNYTPNMPGGSESGYANDDQGNKLRGSNMAVALSGDGYSPGFTSTITPPGIFTNGSTSTIIPSGIFTNAFIRLYNVDSSATEFTYITVPTNQGRNLVFQNVKIRK